MARKSHNGRAESNIRSVTHKSIEQTTGAREETKAEGYFSIYANDVQMQTTPWDIRLTMGEIAVITKNDPTTGATPILNVKVLGDIRISPQLAKTLVTIMMAQLKQYEERFGEIPVPKD